MQDVSEHLNGFIYVGRVMLIKLWYISNWMRTTPHLHRNVYVLYVPRNVLCRSAKKSAARRGDENDKGHGKNVWWFRKDNLLGAWKSKGQRYDAYTYIHTHVLFAYVLMYIFVLVVQYNMKRNLFKISVARLIFFVQNFPSIFLPESQCSMMMCIL